MNYEEALKRWGAGKAGTEEWEDIDVEFDMDPGYACCGGSDPDCYCSFAESPRMNVNVYCKKKVNKYYKRMIVYSSSLEYDMLSFLEELFEVSK